MDSKYLKVVSSKIHNGLTLVPHQMELCIVTAVVQGYLRCLYCHRTDTIVDAGSEDKVLLEARR